MTRSKPQVQCDEHHPAERAERAAGARGVPPMGVSCVAPRSVSGRKGVARDPGAAAAAGAPGSRPEASQQISCGWDAVRPDRAYRQKTFPVTIPKEVAARFPGVAYFEVTEDAGRVILTPLRPSRADEVREQLQDYGIEPGDVEDAVRWARSQHTDGA